MKKAILISVCGIIIMSALSSLLFHFVKVNIREEQSSYLKNIGKEVIIGKDTSMIVDYSTIGHSYMLSNGTTISKEFVK